MTKSKLKKEYQLDEEENTVIVPVESLPEVSKTALKQKVKREMSDKQKENMERLIKANKERWDKLRQERELAQKEAEDKLKKENEEKLKAGTHIKVKIKEKKAIERKPASTRQIIQKPVYDDEDDSTTDFTETDATESDDTDMEDYKHKKRNVRREVKKNLKTLKKIDDVIAQSSNPYMSSLMSRWK